MNVRTNDDQQSSLQIAAVIVAAIATIAALFFGREVLVPLVLAAFFSFLLTPVVRLVERLRVGRAAAVLMVVGFSAGVVGGVGWFVGAQITDLAQEVPKYRHNIIEKIRGLRASVSPFREVSETVEQIKEEIRTPATKPSSQSASEPAPDPAAGGEPDADDVPRNVGISRAPSGQALAAQAQTDVSPDDPGGAEASNPALFPSSVDERANITRSQDEEFVLPGIVARQEPADQPVKVQVVPTGPDLAGLLGGVVGSVLRPLTVAGITVAFSIFFLAYREDLRDRLFRLCGRAHIEVTTTALSDVARSLTRYLVVQVAVNSMNGAAIAVGLLVIGVPNAALWGLMGAILRFVPFVGTWTAAILPTALSIAVFEGWTRPLLVVGWILVVDLLSVNVVEPILYGAGIGISPTAILISLVFWTWLWGGIGLFLATPISVCLAVLGKYVPQLEVLHVLLSDSPAAGPHLRLRQRLAAHSHDLA
jgi:predicted PurR-regulated permease PerM